MHPLLLEKKSTITACAGKTGEKRKPRQCLKQKGQQVLGRAWQAVSADSTSRERSLSSTQRFQHESPEERDPANEPAAPLQETWSFTPEIPPTETCGGMAHARALLLRLESEGLVAKDMDKFLVFVDTAVDRAWEKLLPSQRRVEKRRMRQGFLQREYYFLLGRFLVSRENLTPAGLQSGTDGAASGSKQ